MFEIWELFARPECYPQGLGFTHSSDIGRTFATPSVVPGSVNMALGVNGSQQRLLMKKFAVNRAGEIAIVNSTFKWNEASPI